MFERLNYGDWISLPLASTAEVSQLVSMRDGLQSACMRKRIKLTGTWRIASHPTVNDCLCSGRVVDGRTLISGG